ncbi:MAG: hypothetical protein FWF88_03840 [Peptococcaceae bacterium]|nr:hypothetical protein [Peptococcaceae bacterium]MDR2736449.1 hypothetical protein [Gracilibacteraceae bacterium]
MTDKAKGVLEKIVLAGIGAMAITTDKAKEIVNELIARGELSVEQGKAINEELKHSMKSWGAGSNFADNLENLDKLDADQLAALKAKLQDLETQRNAAQQNDA